MHIDSFYAGQLQLGEGIFVEEARGYVWWVDITGQRVFRANVDGSDLHQWPTPELVGFVLPHPDGERYWLGLKSGPHAARLRPDNVPELARFGTAVDRHAPTVRVNDGSLSPSGDLYVTTMDMDVKQPLGHLLRYDEHGQATPLASNFVIANGPVGHPAQPLVYVAESEGDAGRPKGIYQIDLDSRAETRLIAWPHAGSPDGVSPDDAGTLWVGTYGDSRIRRFSTTGQLLRTIDLPATNVTKIARHGNRLYVTSASDGVSDEQKGQFPLTGHVLLIDDLE